MDIMQNIVQWSGTAEFCLTGMLLFATYVVVVCAVSGGDLQCIYDDREGKAEEVVNTPSAGMPLGIQTPCYQTSMQRVSLLC